VAYVRSLATPQAGDGCAPVADGTAISATRPDAITATTQAGEDESLPRIVDLGAKMCTPCKKMAPILDALRTELAGQARVEFIDITEDRKAAARFGVRVMPTQVFFDRHGQETWRHEGFLPKEDILAKLREAGMR
jgi:thioredoxin 1